MGFDCTLHVVDDSKFAAFEARFLEGERGDGAFDAAYPDADELVAKTQALLASDPKGAGARALGELALLYMSAHTPHVYSRGFALSLWTDEEMDEDLPTKFSAPVDVHLARIFARYPKAKKCIPGAFDGNYCVGWYVPKTRVPQLLKFVTKTLEAKVPGDRKNYAELVTALRVAAERGLSYWEGTDLGVQQTHADWLEVAPPAGMQRHPNDFGVLVDVQAIDGHRWSLHEHWIQHWVDMSTSPPKSMTENNVQYGAHAYTPWGTSFARIATDPNVKPYVFSQLELPERKSLDLPFDVSTTFAFGQAVVLWPFTYASQRKQLVPWVLRQTGLSKLEVPEATPGPDSRALGCFGAPFGDGTALLIWDGRGYRWDGEQAPTLIAAELAAPDGMYCAATTSDGSIVGGFGRRLMRVYADGRQVPGPPLDNVTNVTLGPDDNLIVSEGEHPEADILKIWWPASAQLTMLTPEDVGALDTPQLVHFDRARGELVCAQGGFWHIASWRALAALPRISEAEFSTKRAKLVARRNAKKQKK